MTLVGRSFCHWTMVKEKDEHRDPNSQVKHHINNPKASKCALKETLYTQG